jgi:hypothetical protein
VQESEWMRIDEKEHEIEMLRADRDGVREELQVAKEIIEHLLDDVKWYRGALKTIGVEKKPMKLRYSSLAEFAEARTLHGDDMLLIQLGFDPEVSRFVNPRMTPTPKNSDGSVLDGCWQARACVDVEGRKSERKKES